MARPTKFSQKIADAICSQLIEGKSLRAICKRSGMPGLSTACSWLASSSHAKFQEQYARAREMQAELFADGIMDIADNDKKDILKSPQGEEYGNSTAVQRAKLQVDARKWIASRLLPKKFGDKVQQEHSGPNGTPLAPPILNVTFVDPDDGDERERSA